MNQIILASHGGLAAGARDTLSMVLGDVSNVHVVTLARDDKEPIAAEVERLVTTFDEGDAVYVCTDMLGSSVNNSVVELMNNGAKITVISGMNMPLVLSLAVAQGPLSAEELRAIVREARAGLAHDGAQLLGGKRALSHGEREHQRHVHTADHGDLCAVVHELDHRVVHAAAEHIGAHVDGVALIERGDEALNLSCDGLLVVASERHHMDVRHVAKDHRQGVAGACGKPAVRCQNDLIHHSSLSRYGHYRCLTCHVNQIYYKRSIGAQKCRLRSENNRSPARNRPETHRSPPLNGGPPTSASHHC